MQDDLMKIPAASEYLGMSKGALATLRYTGKGPKYMAPTPKLIFYRKSWCDEWLNASARISTAEAA